MIGPGTTSYMDVVTRQLGYAEKFQKLISRSYPNSHLLRHVRAYELVHPTQSRKLSEKEV